ncbi:MAG: M23 family metallopeptidase [Candidatus Aminicenantes bacterium]|nr:M23 family metallopeptidase [Candidatus Aminicenantes bacterium]
MIVRVKIQKKKSIISRLALLFFTILCLALLLILSFHPKTNSPLQEQDVLQKEEPIDETPPLKESKEIIKRGETISDILSRYNFSSQEIHQLREDVKSVYDLAKIRAGQRLVLFSSPDDEILTMEYGIDKERYLMIRKSDGTYTAEINRIPYVVQTGMIWGSIEDNLINAISQKNEGAQLAILLEEIFAWDIDFYADLRQGDAFKIIFEKKHLEGEFAGYGNILAAEFINQGNVYRAFYYAYPDTQKSDYFDYEGKSLRKEFLKSPISGARITSRFSHSRLHPIRKVWRPHYGVDYAAPIGTPIRATAEGTVTFAGRNGASGRMIRIRHKNGYETMYLHLRQFAQNIRRGVKVQSSQVIGYVGASGEANGPHLDYRIKNRGNYLNPLAHRFKPVEPLRPEFLQDFQKTAARLLLSLDAPQVIASSIASAMTP